MAEIVGAILILGLITSLLIKVFARWNNAVPGILTANGLSLFVATVVAGFGKAAGPQPMFAEAFATYVVPQLLILAFALWRWYRTQNQGQEVTAPAGLMPPAPVNFHSTTDANASGQSIALASAIPSTGAVAEAAPSNPFATAAWRSARDDLKPIPGFGPLAQPELKKPWWKRSLTFIVTLVVMAIAGVIGKEFGKAAYQSVTSPSKSSVHAALVKAGDDLRRTVPKKLDEATTMVDVKVEGLGMTYIHEIGENYEVTDLAKLQQGVKARVCSSRMTNSISQGVSYSYEYWGPAPQKKFWGRFTIASCP